jgi:hypothetical protein
MPTSEHLYEISTRFRELTKLAEDGDEGMAEAIADTLEGIEGEFTEKAEAIVMVATNVTRHVAAIDQQIERLQAKKKAVLNKEESLRSYLKKNMIETGINKIECPLFTITLAKAPKIVEILDEDLLPLEFVNVQTKITPDKVAIKKALKDGEVEGAALKDGTRRLTIK